MTQQLKRLNNSLHFDLVSKFVNVYGFSQVENQMCISGELKVFAVVEVQVWVPVNQSCEHRKVNRGA